MHHDNDTRALAYRPASGSFLARSICGGRRRATSLAAGGNSCENEADADLSSVAMKITDTARARELARRRWERQGAAEAVAAASALEPIASARARRVRALADRAEVEAARLRGELVERAKAERLVFEFARRMRDAWTNWPARVAAPLAARLGADPHAVETALASEVRRHLEEMARDPVPRLGGPGAG